jgi:hypothetical protein
MVSSPRDEHTAVSQNSEATISNEGEGSGERSSANGPEETCGSSKGKLHFDGGSWKIGKEIETVLQVT